MTIYLSALFGGMLIGLAAALLLLTHGRILGVSGILRGLLFSPSEDKLWRLSFLLGLLAGGVILFWQLGMTFQRPLQINFFVLIIGGLLVGAGASLQNGCTSGHSICGMSRLSPRSIVATIIFIIAGVLAVYLLKRVLS